MCAIKQIFRLYLHIDLAASDINPIETWVISLAFHVGITDSLFALVNRAYVCRDESGFKRYTVTGALKRDYEENSALNKCTKEKEQQQQQQHKQVVAQWN